MDILNAIEDRVKLPAVLAVIGSILWLLMASATMVESQAYRYLTLGLSIIAGVYLLKGRLPFVRMPWAGWLSIAWALYAAIRFFYLWGTLPTHQRGTSEWLYIYPLFFPILAVALILYRPYVQRILAAYFVIALAALLVLTDYRGILNGIPVTPMIQNNRIHGAVACGFILVNAFFWMMHNACHCARGDWKLRLSLLCAPPIMLLSLLNIYGSKSKGVWLAVAVALPLAYLFSHGYMRLRALRAVSAALALCLVAGLVLFWGNISQTAGPTLSAIGATVQDMSDSGDVASAVHDAIHSGDTPMSMNERMQLWSNAWQVFSQAPLFGQGNAWLDSWQKTEFSNVGYTLLHNGYLEIMVRHGLFGLGVFFVLMVSFILAVRRGHRDGFISLQATHAYYVSIVYFCMTILSNSNNRLATGESFFMITAAIGLHCMMLSDIRRRNALAEAQTA